MSNGFGFGPAGPGVPAWMTPGFNPNLPHPLADPRALAMGPMGPMPGPVAQPMPMGPGPGGLVRQEPLPQPRTHVPMQAPAQRSAPADGQGQLGWLGRARRGIGQIPERLGRQGPHGYLLSPEEARGRFWQGVGSAGAAMLAQSGRAAAEGRTAGLAEALGAGAPAYFAGQRQGLADVYGARQQADLDAMQQQLRGLDPTDPDYAVKAAQAVMPYNPAMASRIMASAYRGKNVAWKYVDIDIGNGQRHKFAVDPYDPSRRIPIGEPYSRRAPRQPLSDEEIDAARYQFAAFTQRMNLYGITDPATRSFMLSATPQIASIYQKAVRRKSGESAEAFREFLGEAGVPEEMIYGDDPDAFEGASPAWAHEID